MKCLHCRQCARSTSSPSLRRVWVEIQAELSRCNQQAASPSLRRVWVEISSRAAAAPPLLASPSLRRVWVEIKRFCTNRRIRPRHPPCGGCGLKCVSVAALKRSCWSPSLRRVWVEIGNVDTQNHRVRASPSLRRVWVEIFVLDALAVDRVVTLLAEGVG